MQVLASTGLKYFITSHRCLVESEVFWLWDFCCGLVCLPLLPSLLWSDVTHHCGHPKPAGVETFKTVLPKHISQSSSSLSIKYILINMDLLSSFEVWMKREVVKKGDTRLHTYCTGDGIQTMNSMLTGIQSKCYLFSLFTLYFHFKKKWDKFQPLLFPEWWNCPL